MCTVQSDSIIKRTLKKLCCNYGWCYGVFWRFDHRNSLLLTMQDAYYEEEMGVIIDDMLLQVHMLGEGMIGQAAFTKQYRWMFSEDQSGGRNSTGFLEDEDIFQSDSDLHHPFSSGIETIAAISVEPLGVVQFGSTQKILERIEFVDETKRLFQEMEDGVGLVLSGGMSSSPECHIQDPSRLYASSTSSGNLCFLTLKPVDADGREDRIGAAPPLKDRTKLFSSSSEQLLQIMGNSSQVMPFNKSNSQLQQPCMLSTASVNFSVSKAASSSMWSCGDSSPTSFKQSLPSEIMKACDSHKFDAKSSSLVSCRHTFQNSMGNSTLSSAQSAGVSMNITSQCNTGPDVSEGFLMEVDYSSTFSQSCLEDNLPDWFAFSPSHINGTPETTMADELSKAIGLVSGSSGLKGAQNHVNISVNDAADSLQSSITNTVHSDGKDKISTASDVFDDLVNILSVDFGCAQAGNWEGILMPGVTGGHTDFIEDPEFISQQHIGSGQSLFSNLGLKQLSDRITGTDNSVVESSFEDQLSSAPKRRKICGNDQVRISDLPCFSGSMTPLQTVCEMNKTDKTEPKRGLIFELGSWIGDRNGINAGTVVSQPKRHEQAAKTTKKKAKPGARPRPKDRQLTQDRLAELRELIPNGRKLSIDSLLDQTIKNMVFFRSVMKHAGRLKQAAEPKHKESLIQGKDSGGRGGGVTWACEFGGQTMVCPLIVEDLSSSGQMLIEMLCEEQGFFLEIVDVIKSFGLTILKGLMEAQDNKISARFIVETEGNRHVTRHEIFSSLVRLLQITGSCGDGDPHDQCGNANDGGGAGSSLFNFYQQSALPPSSSCLLG